MPEALELQGLGGGKRDGINRIRREPDGEKAVSGNADTALETEK